ncbi:MAG: hypothetical protein J07HQX50_00237 [Haloquadratum sp. J07HQX50]|nr:MAG: hypothetical protein J07HQX50_00237 [Haloquadratum sp. J07HQX50]
MVGMMTALARSEVTQGGEYERHKTRVHARFRETAGARVRFYLGKPHWRVLVVVWVCLGIAVPITGSVSAAASAGGMSHSEESPSSSASAVPALASPSLITAGVG